jgi:hypothetical protein
MEILHFLRQPERDRLNLHDCHFMTDSMEILAIVLQ